jgi:hypothetical protein
VSRHVDATPHHPANDDVEQHDELVRPVLFDGAGAIVAVDTEVRRNEPPADQEEQRDAEHQDRTKPQEVPVVPEATAHDDSGPAHRGRVAAGHRGLVTPHVAMPRGVRGQSRHPTSSRTNECD